MFFKKIYIHFLFLHAYYMSCHPSILYLIVIKVTYHVKSTNYYLIIIYLSAVLSFHTASNRSIKDSILNVKEIILGKFRKAIIGSIDCHM
jgi:uncharacterized protein YggT (Ycf19 family)